MAFEARAACALTRGSGGGGEMISGRQSAIRTFIPVEERGIVSVIRTGVECGDHRRSYFLCLRPPRCVSTGPVVARLAGMANERERERIFRTAVLNSNLGN